MFDTSAEGMKVPSVFCKINLDRLCINMIVWLKIKEFVSVGANNINEEEDKLRQAMKKLPEEQAKMIFAAYYEEKSHREIAEDSGLPLGTVKSRIRLALSRLRRQIDEDER